MNDASSSPRSLTNGALRYPVHYQDVMVHLDGGEEDEIRIAHAEMLADLAGGRLTGMFTNPLPDMALYASEQGTMAVAELTETIREQGKAINKKLQERFQRIGVPNEVRTLEDVSAFLSERIVTEARWADLFVASCPYHEEALHDWDSLVESVMFEAGHSIYLVPRGVKPRSEIRTVMIAWLDTKEAARAIAEALPLLKLATKTELVTVHEPEKGRMDGAEALADIAAHLSHHGIDTTVTIVRPKENVAAALLDQAHRISADVIVSGAYGHSRFREWILGGATQDLIRHTDLPLFMAH